MRERFRVEVKCVKSMLICVALLVLAACGQNKKRDAAPTSPEVQPTVPPPGTGPDARTPFAPVKPAIDPKSTEVAEELVRGFAQLLTERRFDEAYKLLGPGAPPQKAFEQQWARADKLVVTVEKAGEQEGAAGSIYLTVPLKISEQIGGKRFDRTDDVIVRRVNDVPGSTVAQRRWHIERIDWTSAG